MRLYGVHHGGCRQDVEQLLTGGVSQIYLSPSEGMIGHLLTLPKGSRIGVEWFTKETFNELHRYREEKRKLKGIKATFEDSPTDYYWLTLIRAISNVGHDIVFLEEEKLWKEYIDAVLEEGVLTREAHKLHSKDQKNNLLYYELDRRIHQAQVHQLKVHRLKRDAAFLERIAKEELAATVNGDGHAAYWFANKDQIMISYGEVFNEYHTDKGAEMTSMNPRTRFIRNAAPDPGTVFDIVGTQRAVRLIEKGRIVEEREPDYVGFWNFKHPWKGYFEMFVEKTDGEKISGTIEDCLGSASFEGRQNKEGIRFTKLYNPSLCTSDALQYGIDYLGLPFEGGFAGFYKVHGGGAAFALCKYEGKKPTDLAKRFSRVGKEHMNVAWEMLKS